MGVRRAWSGWAVRAAGVRQAVCRHRDRPVLVDARRLTTLGRVSCCERSQGMALGRPRSFMRNLDGRTMFVSTTAADGVVSAETRLHFAQRGRRVVARYAGGRVLRGWLVGRWDGDILRFRYAQREESSTIHGGQSVCVVEERADGRLRLIEHFTWSTRSGSGANVFDELPPPSI